MERRIAALAVLLLAASLLPGVAGAAEEEKKKEKQRSGFTVNKAAYEGLIAAQEAMQAGDVATARAALAELRKKEDKLNDHEKALLYQTYGYLEAGEDRYDKATTYLEKCLSYEALPEGGQLQTLYNLAQLYLATERYPEATKTLISWFRRSKGPGPPAFYMLAVTYYQQERYDRALKPAILAVKKAGAKPKEPWLQMLLSLRLQNKQYKEALPVIERLTDLYPKKSYWMQLAAIYGELGRDKKSLAALELAYTQGLLDEDDELRRLAQLYVYHEIPYRGALVIEKGMKAGVIEPDIKSYELLANAWMRAREWENAIGPLTKAADRSGDGELYLRLGQAYAQREEWGPAEDALRKAVKKGGLDDPGGAHLLLGVASFNQQKLDSARTYFARAAQSEKTREDAQRWLQHVEQAERAAENEAAG